jgi:hypothetical protein
MVVEFPDPACAEGSRVLKQITSARRQFLKHFQQPTKKFAVYKTSPVKVRVVGVGFFDKIHGQKGMLPKSKGGNGIELRPVLSITLAD